MVLYCFTLVSSTHIIVLEQLKVKIAQTRVPGFLTKDLRLVVQRKDLPLLVTSFFFVFIGMSKLVCQSHQLVKY